ncbi:MULTISPECIES: OmpA family protein [Xanthomonas translucens group]|uniref:OmpA family protein n=1 Tax=Xanthomonas translucens group TaxID=3390202 RepID=UPI0005790174|nr:OmpA family protein [Xanthomonas translucens]UKE46709.1 OmpA family protein [Xanthomonas translucens pv. cerealis]UKE69055.1 OmpA family protein [Xanthomonas translucens pv. pistacia]
MSRRLGMAGRLAALLLLVAPLAVFAADDPELAVLNQRLVALQADPLSADVAAYERLQAQQAVAAFAAAKRKEQDDARYLAERRVEIAETAARAALARRQVEQLEKTRSDLLVEASRREATRARQEAERLRVQAQIQAEEAASLRQAAEAEQVARQDAEQALTNVAGQQTAKLSAAQQKSAKLAREEAELVAGAKLPASRFEPRGEVFTVAGGAFAAGKAALSADAAGQAKALAQYLQIGAKSRVRIEAYDADAGVAQKRADALRDALVAGGVAASRLQAVGKKAPATKARAAEVVISP